MDLCVDYTVYTSPTHTGLALQSGTICLIKASLSIYHLHGYSHDIPRIRRSAHPLFQVRHAYPLGWQCIHTRGGDLTFVSALL